MQESGSKLYESLPTFSQKAEHNATQNTLDEFDFSSMPTDADSCWELNADFVGAESCFELNADLAQAESCFGLNANLDEAVSCFGQNADLAEDESCFKLNADLAKDESSFELNADLADVVSCLGLNADLAEAESCFELNADLAEAVSDFELTADLAEPVSCFEQSSDLEKDELTTDNTYNDFQTDKGTKRKHSETTCSSDPLLSSDTSGYESDIEDEREVKRARRKKLRARRSRDYRVASLDISRGVKRDLEAEDTAEAPNKRLHHTPASDESPASQSSSEESVLDALGLELSSDSSSDSEESLASDSEPYVFSCSDSDTCLERDDSSSDSDTCLERDDSSSDYDTCLERDGSSSDSDTCLERGDSSSYSDNSPECDDSSSDSDKCLDSDDSSSDSETCLDCDDSSSESEFSSDFDSGLGYSTNLTSSDSDNLDTDSDGSESSLLASRILKCPKTCVCRAGPSNPPIPIERGGAVGSPLLKRLLRSRLLGPANLSPFYCCGRRCCLKWEKGFRR